MKILTYPKNKFSKKHVLNDKNKEFKFSKAWVFSEDSKNYYLKLDQNLVLKHYFVKRKSLFERPKNTVWTGEF